MKYLSNQFFLLNICLTLLIGCNSTQEPLRLATYTYSTNDRIENLKPLAADLESALNRSVQIRSYPDVASFIEGIKSNQVDIALINTLGYLILSLDNKHMIPFTNLQVKEGAIDNYKTVLLTNNEQIKDYTSFSAQADQFTMMFVKEGSTSGNLIPRLFLSAINIPDPESQFKQVKYGGTHASTLEKLIRGETDLCAIGSNEYIAQIERDSTISDTVKLLWESEEIPLGPVLINKSLSANEKTEIANLFLKLHDLQPASFQSIKSGWSEAKHANKFQIITDEYYNSFREINGSSTSLNDILDRFKD